MGADVLASILGALLGLAGAGLASSQLAPKLIRRLLGVRERPAKPYSERLTELTASLTKASREVDTVLTQLAQVARNRQEAVQGLEADLAALEAREKELKKKIEALEATPLPVAEHFTKMLEARENRSAKRDYVLFAAGVVVTTLFAIIIRVLVG